MHRGEYSAAEIAQVGYVKKWSHSVYDGGTVKNYELKENPQVFIFDHTGKMVYDPVYGIDFERKAADFASEAPDWVLGDREFEVLETEARNIEKRNYLGTTLTDLQAKAESAEGKEKEEADYLLERLNAYASWIQGRAERKFEEGFPSEAEDLWREISKQFKDHEIGAKADEMQARFDGDEAWKNELLAEKMVRSFESSYYRIRPRESGGDPDKWERRYGRYVKQVEDRLETIREKYGETKVLARLKELAQRVGIG